MTSIAELIEKRNYEKAIEETTFFLYEKCEYKLARDYLTLIKSKLDLEADHKFEKSHLDFYLAITEKRNGNVNEAARLFNSSLKLGEALKPFDYRLWLSCITGLIEIAYSESDVDALARYEELLFEKRSQSKTNEGIDLTVRNWFDYLSILIKGLFFKSSPRNRDKVKAEEIYRQFVESSEFEYQNDINKITIISHLLELIILELKMYPSNELELEVASLVDKLQNLSNHIPDYICYYQSYKVGVLIITTKMELIQGNFDKARDLLVDAQAFARKNQFADWLQIIDLELTSINNEYGNLKRLIAKNSKIGDLIEQTNILDYLHKVQSGMLEL